MSTKTYTQNLQAGVEAQFPAGSIFLITQATAALSIVATTLGDAASDTELFGVQAGFKFKAAEGDGWTMLQVLSATTQVVTIAIGDDEDVNFSNAVTITGTPNVQVSPGAAINATAHAPLVTAITAGAALFPANAARRRITVWSDPQNAGTVYFFDGTNKCGFIQPGTYIEFDNVSALQYADAVGSNTLYFFEET